MDTIAHFTPLKNLPCCYYWKDFDRTLNWHLNSLLAINIKRCYNNCNFIVRQLDFAKTKEKASYLFEKALIKNEKTFKKEDDSIFNYYCFLFNKIKRVLMEFEGIYRNRIALSVWRGCKSDFVINPECINSAKETLQKIIALKDILIEISK